MFRSLVRWKFVDRNWDSETLTRLAEFWLRLFEAAEGRGSGVREPYQALELRLTGFTRSMTRAVADALARQLHESGVTVDVSSDDPDTLVAKTKRRTTDREPFPGFGVHALAGAPFDGLVVELRFTVAESSSPPAGAMLVVVGELRDGTVAVKAIWADLPTIVVDEGRWESYAWEDHILAAFDNFRSYDKVDREFATACFSLAPDVSGRSPDHFISWGVNVPFGRPRLRGLLFACIYLLVLCAISVTLAVVAFENLPPRRYPLIVFVFVILAPLYEFIRYERPFLRHGYRVTRELYDNYFRVVPRWETPAPNDPRPWLNDPIVRKLVAEVLDAGFVFAGDAVPAPLESAARVHCVFLAPDGVTYLLLAFEFGRGSGAGRAHLWPVSCNTLCQTVDAEGNRSETTDGTTHCDPIKRRLDPSTRSLVLPRVTHPLTVFETHAKALADWTTGSAARLRPHEPIERFWERRIEEFDKERQLYLAHPYSWRDQFRWYLQLDAKPCADTK